MAHVFVLQVFKARAVKSLVPMVPTVWTAVLYVIVKMVRNVTQKRVNVFVLRDGKVSNVTDLAMKNILVIIAIKHVLALMEGHAIHKPVYICLFLFF